VVTSRGLGAVGPRRDLGLVQHPRIRCGRLSGHGEIRAFWQRFQAAFEEIRLELVDVLEVEDDLLIVENVAYMRGRDGIEVQARSAWLVTIRGGEQLSLTLYQTKQDALEAAGLRE
jgi:ketosteroid isomerase-like protein